MTVALQRIENIKRDFSPGPRAFPPPVPLYDLDDGSIVEPIYPRDIGETEPISQKCGPKLKNICPKIINHLTSPCDLANSYDTSIQLSNIMSREKLLSGLGMRIREAREAMGLKQEDFAKPLGIKQSHISAIEKGIREPSQTLLTLMSYHYAIREEWLKTGSGEMFGARTLQPPTQQLENVPPDIAELLELASKVLISGNQRASDALAKNIQYFAHAVEVEKEMDAMKSRITKLEERLNKLTEKDPDPGGEGSAKEKAM